MSGRTLTCILTAALFAPALVTGAEQTGQVGDEVTRASQASVDLRPRDTKLYEDIEILRRLLNNRLQSQYQPLKAQVQANAVYTANNCTVCHLTYKNSVTDIYGNPLQYGTNNPYTTWPDINTHYPWLINSLKHYPLTYDFGYPINNPHTKPQVTLDTEGIYLKGQGVIYTMTLPPSAEDPRPEAPRPPQRTVSDWDRVRRELRNEKPEDEDQSKKTKHATLGDMVLKVLADNGHHLAQLGANESLTIAITFRSAGGSEDVANTILVGELKNASPNDAQPAQTAGNTTATTTTGSSGGTSTTSTTGKTSVNDYELLADLQAKQGKTDEAIKAYREALEQKPGANKDAEINRKLATLLLSQNKVAEARAALDRLEADLRSVSNQKAAAPKKETNRRPDVLPAKLIISAPKNLLDQVGAGKITYDDFKKACTVEYLTFPAPAR